MSESNSTGKALPIQAKKSNTKLTTAIFIERSIAKHGDAYDYSKVEYKNAKTKVKIFCKKCKQYFYQLPPSHMKGRSCYLCCGNNQLTTNEFIKRAKDKHGDFYNYSNSIYKNSETKLIITCPKHGNFEQYPLNHIKGHGCKECAIDGHSKRYTTPFDDFEKKAKEKHNNFYSYDRKSYKRTHAKVNICCPLHGWFSMEGSSHLQGRGCRQCGFELSGYSRSRFKKLCNKHNSGNGLLYLIKCFDEKEVFFKIGITSRSVKIRYAADEKLPYQYKTLYEIYGEACYIFDIESRLHSLLKEHHYTPGKAFKGSVYECFSEIPKDVEKLLKTLENSQQMQLIA